MLRGCAALSVVVMFVFLIGTNYILAGIAEELGHARMQVSYEHIIVRRQCFIACLKSQINWSQRSSSVEKQLWGTADSCVVRRVVDKYCRVDILEPIM